MLRLRILDVEENYLESIPNEVGRLRELTRLVLQSNALIQLPRAIGQLSSLQYLSVGENYLSFLPEVKCEIDLGIFISFFSFSPLSHIVFYFRKLVLCKH